MLMRVSYRNLNLHLVCVVVGAAILSMSWSGVAAEETIHVRAAGFEVGKGEVHAGTNQIVLKVDQAGLRQSFCESAIKQSAAQAKIGPDPKIPYFTVRFAMPIPPENATDKVAALTGIEPGVFTHNHSPGFAIMPNGDALAVWFSTPPGKAEKDPSTSFVQARLRYGSEEWDMPEVFYKTKGFNDQSGLMWNDHGKIWFFGGGRGMSDWVPFKIATSDDNGATWKLSLPQLDQPAESYTAQPITSAFRGPDGAIYMAMDGHGAHSFLWRSRDDGVHWHDMGGRTGGRHSTIVPLDDKGDLLSIGGKNAAVNGWSPENRSTNWGVTWSASVASPFPPLGSAQRPSLIKLADGNLFFVSDAYLQKAHRDPPPGWKYGKGPFVAISTNQGASWHIKPLPVHLPNFEYRTFGTVGYVTARQAPNGVIHVLTTVTQPCLDYEMNEAWVFSDAGDIHPETTGGVVKHYEEHYPNGQLRSKWSARICPHGRYLLTGRETDYYANGKKEHEVTYLNGRKTGSETFWAANGTKISSWQHDLKHNRSVWTHYWPNGRKKIESTWNTKPTARDLDRQFFGMVADGPVHQWHADGSPAGTYYFTNGVLDRARSSSLAQRVDQKF